MFTEMTAFEREHLETLIAAGEFPAPGMAVHRMEVITSDSTVGATVINRTNDNNDDGYPDGEWVEWENTFGTADKALEYVGRCHIGVSGVVVTVIHNGEEIR